MPILKELESKKAALKKTEKAEGRDDAPEVMIVKDETDYYRLMRETYFEDYYQQIEGFTFKSTVVGLSLEETQALLAAHTAFLAGAPEVDLASVEAKVEEGIAGVRAKVGGACRVFVRLSSRSPKDAIYHLDTFTELFKEKLAEFEDSEDVFSKLHAFYKASTEVMAISSGKEASGLLRRSARIQGDLQHCLDASEPMNLIVREFVAFPVKNELRGFVHRGAFTALTQYNNLAFFPEHLATKQEVEAKVKTFMVGFIRAMQATLDSFVIDIAIDEAGKVWVVEVNPFGELAGSCLFSWSKDRGVLQAHLILLLVLILLPHTPADHPPPGGAALRVPYRGEPALPGLHQVRGGPEGARHHRAAGIAGGEGPRKETTQLLKLASSAYH